MAGDTPEAPTTEAAWEGPMTADEGAVLRRILALPKFGHHIKGDPDEGPWWCTCDAADEFDSAEEHIAKAVFRGAFPFIRAESSAEIERTAAKWRASGARDALITVGMLNGNGRDEPSDPALDAAEDALRRLIERLDHAALAPADAAGREDEG